MQLILYKIYFLTQLYTWIQNTRNVLFRESGEISASPIFWRYFPFLFVNKQKTIKFTQTIFQWCYGISSFLGSYPKFIIKNPYCLKKLLKLVRYNFCTQTVIGVPGKFFSATLRCLLKKILSIKKYFVYFLSFSF